jgi:hypothetical protein
VTGRDDPAATVVACNACVDAHGIDGLAARMAVDGTPEVQTPLGLR